MLDVVADINSPGAWCHTRESHTVRDGVALDKMTLLGADVPVHPATRAAAVHAIRWTGRRPVPALIEVSGCRIRFGAGGGRRVCSIGRRDLVPPGHER